MAQTYQFVSYWNPSWIPKISNQNVFALEHSLFEAGQLVQLPGIVPGTSGFQGGDTIDLAFQVAGGNSPQNPLALTQVTVKFMKQGGFGPGEAGNPIGLAGGRIDFGIWAFTCADFQSSVIGGEPAQLLKDGNANASFTFAGGDSTWVVYIEAVYTRSDGSTMTFAFDPEWIVGSGGSGN